MAKNGKAVRENGEQSDTSAQSVVIASRGVQNSDDFRNLMCALMSDVIQGNISTDVVNAACNASRSLLKMVELEYRASTPSAGAKPTLPLSRRIGTVASA
jgi:hypothetical protein